MRKKSEEILVHPKQNLGKITFAFPRPNKKTRVKFLC